MTLKTLCVRSALLLVLLSNAAPAQAAPNLSGRWARLEVTTALSKVPVLGDLTSQTRAWTIVTLNQQGQGLEVQEQLCGLQNETLGGAVQTVFPPAFIQAVSGHPRQATLRVRGSRLQYQEDRPLRVNGAQLEDPKNDALPQSSEDPRLKDPDGDGQPGLTVRIEGFVEGQVYVVQRDASQLRGEVHTNGRLIKGLIRWSAEQSVVGASRDMLNKNPQSRPHPEPKRSYFRMRRIPNNASCQQVLARRDTLFGPKV